MDHPQSNMAIANTYRDQINTALSERCGLGYSELAPQLDPKGVLIDRCERLSYPPEEFAKQIMARHGFIDVDSKPYARALNEYRLALFEFVETSRWEIPKSDGPAVLPTRNGDAILCPVFHPERGRVGFGIPNDTHGDRTIGIITGDDLGTAAVANVKRTLAKGADMVMSMDVELESSGPAFGR